MNKILLTLAMLFATASAFAQCEAPNLVQNCSFENGATGWTLSSGDSAASSSTALSGSFSLAVDAVEISSYQDSTLTQCIQVDPETIYGTGFYARMEVGQAKCWPRVLWHSNTTCTNFIAIDSFPGAPVGANWTFFAEAKTSPAGAVAANFDLACTNYGADFIVLYDDAFFGVFDEIFADGFE